MSELIKQAELARAAAMKLMAVPTEKKDEALRAMADALDIRRAEILRANAEDVQAARQAGFAESFIERLTLTGERIDDMRQGLHDVANLPDPVGEITEEWDVPSGLHIRKRRAPLGVIAIIYESRPNVTVDAAALCLKSGNACILRGGSDAIRSNSALMDALTEAARSSGLPEGCVSLVRDTSREVATELMRLNGYVDVLIPRGGKGLIDSVVKQASVPVIQTGDGICHIYVDDACDPQMAQKIAVSAKVSRPSTCNAAEALLVHKDVAAAFLPACADELRKRGVELRCDARARAIVPWAKLATAEDFLTEFNALIYAVGIVDSLTDAIEFINAHNTKHSETIVTSDPLRARRFQTEVDAAVVYVNASTRFTDGGAFGFGAEIGISNQKLHARGPMGLRELTCCRYEVDGAGQVR